MSASVCVKLGFSSLGSSSTVKTDISETTCIWFSGTVCHSSGLFSEDCIHSKKDLKYCEVKMPWIQCEAHGNGYTSAA